MTGSSHVPTYLASINLYPICPWSDVEAPGVTEIEEHRPGIVQQTEYPYRSFGGDQVEVGHAAPDRGCPSPRS